VRLLFDFVNKFASDADNSNSDKLNLIKDSIPRARGKKLKTRKDKK
jgi:hypothetical protein